MEQLFIRLRYAHSDRRKIIEIEELTSFVNQNVEKGRNEKHSNRLGQLQTPSNK